MRIYGLVAVLLLMPAVTEAQPYYRPDSDRTQWDRRDSDRRDWDRRDQGRRDWDRRGGGGYGEAGPGRQRPPVVCFVDRGLESYRSYPWCEVSGFPREGSRCTCPSFGQTRLPGTVGPR
jgi:hypothetical protein